MLARFWKDLVTSGVEDAVLNLISSGVLRVESTTCLIRRSVNRPIHSLKPYPGIFRFRNRWSDPVHSFRMLDASQLQYPNYPALNNSSQSMTTYHRSILHPQFMPFHIRLIVNTPYNLCTQAPLSYFGSCFTLIVRVLDNVAM